MVANFFSWWFARMVELFPRLAPNAAGSLADAVIVEVNSPGMVTALLRRKNREEAIPIDTAVRLAGHKAILLRPPASMVLDLRHTVPTASHRDLTQLLRHELARITPFSADTLFWRWDGQSQRLDKTRREIALTMVPKATVASTIGHLAALGLQPSFLEVGLRGSRRLVPLEDADTDRSARRKLSRGLAWTSASLAVLALAIPFVLQAHALHVVNGEIENFQPAVRHAEVLRRGLTADGSEREVLARETQQTGDVLQVIAMVTRVLPDDTFLTDLSLRNRHFALGGRSTSAPRLITGLSADPAIRSAAFSAPVTRLEGAALEVFSIQGEIIP